MDGASGSEPSRTTHTARGLPAAGRSYGCTRHQMRDGHLGRGDAIGGEDRRDMLYLSPEQPIPEMFSILVLHLLTTFWTSSDTLAKETTAASESAASTKAYSTVVTPLSSNHNFRSD